MNKPNPKIAFLSDSHQNYQDLDKAIDAINSDESVDFVVMLGDFTNSGYNLEYDQYLKQINELNVPILTVLGNHDAIGAGASLYRKAFGELDYVFETDYQRYIIFNSNNLETPEDFSIAWLEEQVSTSTKPVYIFTHVPLQDADRFFGQEYDRLQAVINHNNVEAVFYGHNHSFQLIELETTNLVQVPRVEGEQKVIYSIGEDSDLLKVISQALSQEFFL